MADPAREPVYPETPEERPTTVTRPTAEERPTTVTRPTAVARPTAVERPATITAPTTTRRVLPRPNTGGLIARLLLSMAGAAGMIVGAFLPWLASRDGVDISVRSLWGPAFGGSATMVASVGMVSVVLGLVGVVGLAPRSGWLTRLAGALGIVAAVLFYIEVFRAPGPMDLGNLGVGFWLAVVGSIVALVGGFMGTRYRVIVPAEEIDA